jgi:Tfp pilus assembly PilM family ATPase
MLGNLRRGWIGIEWGTQTLKIAQAECKRGELRIAASAMVPRRPTSPEIQDPLSIRPAWSAQDLQAALASDSRFTGKKAACVLPIHLTDLRTMAIPPGSPAERHAMVSNEISSLRGDTGEEIEFDFWESGHGDSIQATESVNTLSVSSRLVAELTQTLSRAGLCCEILDGLPLALSRAAAMQYGLECPPTAVLDWGFASSIFCVVRAGKLIFSRHLRNCGLAKLFETVGQLLNLPEEDVLEILARYGLPEESSADASTKEIQAAIAEAARPHLNEIVEELRRTIAYLGTQFAGIVLERLCLTGDGAAVRHTDRFLSDLIGLSVDVWQLPATAANGRSGLPHESASLGAAFALSVLAWNPIHGDAT